MFTTTAIVGGGHAYSSLDNKGMVASVTTADFQVACPTPIAATPAGHAYIRVMVNGRGADLGDGSRDADCYYSADGGLTAKGIRDVAAGDLLFWVATVAGYQLDESDVIDFDYAVYAV